MSAYLMEVSTRLIIYRDVSSHADNRSSCFIDFYVSDKKKQTSYVFYIKINKSLISSLRYEKTLKLIFAWINYLLKLPG